MLIYNYQEAVSDLSLILDNALANEVVIKNKNGFNFKLIPIIENNDEKSPLENIKGIKANITTQELVEIIREGREKN